MQDTSTSFEKKPATYADIEALPENMVGEILFGELHVHPRPATRHARAAWRLAGQLDGPFDRGIGGPGGWIFMPEPELHLGDHIVVPDIAAWRRERMKELPETSFVELPPDWAAEILSPSTEQRDRTDKLGIYAEFGVGHAWYVNPIARTLEVLKLLEGGKYQIAATYKDDDPIAASPFEAHTFPLDVLWPEAEG